MNLSNFGMDSITLAGPLDGKLQASLAAGFSQIMLWARDLSWGRHVSQYEQAWEVVQLAEHANLGLVIDSFHVLAKQDSLDYLQEIPSHKIALVQLSDFMWRQLATADERLDTARHLRVFPGEGAHSAELAELLRRLDRCGYRGDFSFEVFNDDYLQLPLPVVARRAQRSAKWVTDQVLRRSLELRRRDAVAAVPARKA
jgi:2-keto-myo-inositol isomerase